MTQSWIAFENVSFTYDAATKPLIEGLTAHFPVGWTGIVGANGAGKTTILRLATGGLAPRSGQIVIPGQALYCPQRTDAPPPMFARLLSESDGEALTIRGRLGVADDWLDRWQTLSHGERKRAQIAVVLWRKPAVLAIDEPTNHIDAGARALLAQALRSYEGAGLLVSHDREFLDTLCEQCLFVEPPAAIMRHGGYSQALAQRETEAESARRERAQLKKAHKKLKREVARRRDEASQAHRKRSKRGLAIKDHDARAKKDLARVTGKDGRAGRLLNQLRGRERQAADNLENTKVKKLYELGIWMSGTQSRRDALIRMPAGTIPLGAGRRLRFPDLLMRPSDRIALTGPNGAGKSTLLAHIMPQMNLPRERITYVPQEITLGSSRKIMDEVRRQPNEILGRIMCVVSRLNSRPDRLLESDAPSPGEIRKLLLALGIARGPHLIVMDEPTNHLDLPSVECLEQALDECPCGLLLVSHDRRFLQRLTRTCWHLNMEGKDSEVESRQEPAP